MHKILFFTAQTLALVSAQDTESVVEAAKVWLVCQQKSRTCYVLHWFDIFQLKSWQELRKLFYPTYSDVLGPLQHQQRPPLSSQLINIAADLNLRG